MIGVIDESLRYQVRLERLSARVLRLMAGDLNAAIEEVERQLRARTRVDAPFTFDRLQALQIELAAVRRALEAQLVAAITEGLAGVTETAGPVTIKAMQAAEVPVILNLVAPPIEIIAQATAATFDDRRWPQWGSRLADDVVGRLNSELRQAAFLGETIPKIRDRFAKVGKLSQTSARRLARTSINAASNRARGAVFQANRDILDGWRFVGTLDSRQSRICAALDQKVFGLDDPDAPWPPRHPNCRSIAVPEVTGAKSQGTRASSDGQVPATTDYDAFLRRQPKAFQIESMGKTRWQAWQNGLAMENFATPTRELTVGELTRLYPKEMEFAA